MIVQFEPVESQEKILGFLKHRSEWDEAAATKIAEQEGIELTPRHWEVIHFIRTEFYTSNGMVPREIDIKRGMERIWKAPVADGDLLNLFPQGANNQGAKIAGCITMKTVQDLLDVKGGAVWSVSAEQPIIDALKVLSDKNVGALMVVDNNELVGVVSERDYTRDVVMQDRTSQDTKVKEIMTSEVISVSPSDSLEQCMVIMIERGFRHLPVLENGRLAGVLSMPDLVKVIVDQQRFTIARLEEKFAVNQ